MFATTLPILFGFTRLISALEFAILLIALSLLVFLITPTVNAEKAGYPYSSFYLYLHATWLGHMQLWRVFWRFGHFWL